MGVVVVVVVGTHPLALCVAVGVAVGVVVGVLVCVAVCVVVCVLVGSCLIEQHHADSTK